MRLLVLCPTIRDYRELRLLTERECGLEVVFDESSSQLTDYFEQLTSSADPPRREVDLAEEFEAIVSRYRGNRFDGVLSTDDYPGTILASLAAKRWNIPGTPLAANLCCQHKLFGRELQSRAVPDNTPRFVRWGEAAPFSPLFVKPAKSFFSIAAGKVEESSQLPRFRHPLPPQAFFAPFDRLVKELFPVAPTAGQFIVEEFISGQQCTLEGFVFRGELQTVGVVDSLFFPESISFRRFEYPSRLPLAVQEEMESIAGRALRAVDYDYGCFNIEFIYDGERPYIIEINPRSASQFADLYEKVDGTNGYRIAMDLAVGRKPNLCRRAGEYRYAASCVFRTFQDMFVRRVPGEADIQRVERRFPGARVEILTAAGAYLSETIQDTESCRYGLVNLGASSREELEANSAECQRLLPFELIPPFRSIHPSEAKASSYRARTI